MINLNVGSIFNSPCDLLVVPCNSEGIVNNEIVKDLKLHELPLLEQELPFGEILIQKSANGRVVCFASSVNADGMYSTGRIVQTIAHKIVAYAAKNGLRNVNIPLLGTGAGKLSIFESFAALQSVAKNIEVIFDVYVLSRSDYRKLKTVHEADIDGEPISEENEGNKLQNGMPSEGEIKQLPRWARVAFAARCARRVQPLFNQFWSDAPAQHNKAVERAIRLAEESASKAFSNEEALYAASEADNAAVAALGGSNQLASDPAYAAAYAAYLVIDQDNLNNTRSNSVIRSLSKGLSRTEKRKYVQQIRNDYERLNKHSREYNWNGRTPVTPDMFGPMWPEEEPDWERRTTGHSGKLKTSNSIINGKLLPAEKELKETVFEFLIEKGWKQGQIEMQPDNGVDNGFDIALRGENRQLLAVVQLKLFNDREMVFAEAFSIQPHIRRIDEKALGYTICLAPKLQNKLEVYEYSGWGNPVLLKSQDFPNPSLMRFLYALGDKGRSIVRSLISCADELALKVSAKSDRWINLQVGGSTAAQIHWYKHPDVAVGLALAGYIETYSDSPYHFPRGTVEELGGYKSGIQAELNWLNGKLGHERLKYRSTVCVIEKELNGFPERIDEVRALLQIAKGNTEIGSETDGLKTPARNLGIPIMESDSPNEEDMLGRKRLAESLAKMFLHTKDMEGFTVALLGEWGEGKSTVMRLVRKELKKQPFEFAEFNAWEYEHTDNIAAGLAQEVLKGLLKFKKAAYLRQLWLRIRFACKAHPWGIVGLCACIFIAAGASLLLYWNRDLFWLGVTSISFAPLLLKTYNAYKRAQSHSLALQMLEYLKMPEYQKHLGLVPILKKDIQTLCNLRLAKTRKLLVFVDDLDRCQPGCIAKTLDAIRLVMSIKNVIVMIGIDHRIAFKAVEKTYERLEDGSRSKADIARDYLGKIILLPVRLSTTGPLALQEYVNKKLFPDAEETVHQEKMDSTEIEPKVMPSFYDGNTILSYAPEIMTEQSDYLEQSSSMQTEQENAEEEIEKAMHETTEERDEFYDLAVKFKFSNPRQLLRLRNSYRLLKALNGQGQYECERLLPMIFWQEFLHNYGIKIRHLCMAAIKDETLIGKIVVAETRNIVKTVRNEIAELFNNESYEKIAEFVRCVVLPHSEEGVLDTVEEIDEWLRKTREKEGANIKLIADQSLKTGS